MSIHVTRAPTVPLTSYDTKRSKATLNNQVFGLQVAYHVCENIKKICGITISISFQHVEVRDL